MNNSRNELAYIRQMLLLLDTNAAVSIVGDAYDIYNFIGLMGSIKDEILEKTNRGQIIVIRPDSGDPLEVLPKVLRLAADNFGYVVNDKGYKLINNVRFIQGDGITIDTLQPIINVILESGYSLDNIAFGMGGGLLQHVNRDDQKFAMKCSAVCVDGKWIDVFKDPITDPGKTSKRGRLALSKISSSGEYLTHKEDLYIKTPTEKVLNVVYEWNGKGRLMSEQPFAPMLTFEEIRDNSNK